MIHLAEVYVSGSNWYKLLEGWIQETLKSIFLKEPDSAAFVIVSNFAFLQ